MATKRTRASHKGAPKKPTEAGGVLSRARAFHEAFYSDTESGTESDGLRGQVASRGQLRRKRGRKPKRPRTATSEVPEDSENDSGDKASKGDQPENKKDMPARIVDGVEGPLVQISMAELVANSNLTKDDIFKLAGLNSNSTKKTTQPKQTSFVDLPIEIAERIYRKVFVTQEEPVMLTSRMGMSRSGQVLRTCRQVYEQGSKVLYGQNSFHFSRSHHTRGAYFEKEWTEIGYKDIRRFMNDIGHHNLAKLKYVSIDFEDALPSLTPRLNNVERRYVNNATLQEVLRMLGKHTELNMLTVSFHGRSSLSDRDYDFLKALCSIRCIELTSTNTDRVNSATYASIKSLVRIPPPLVTTIDHSKNKYAPMMHRNDEHFIGGVDDL